MRGHPARRAVVREVAYAGRLQPAADMIGRMGRFRPYMGLLPVVLLVSPLTARDDGTAYGVAAQARQLPPATATATETSLVMRYSFDSGIDSQGRVADDSGRGHTLRLIGSRGAVTEVERADGVAIQFPGGCDAGGGCAKAILETPHGDDLNPGSRPFRVAATVRLEPDRTSAGSNVVQKGYARSGSQWKLQVDGREGRPSCVLVGGTSHRIYRALANASVADGEWHVLECLRSGPSLQIRMDGDEVGDVRVPDDLSVVNHSPVRIGGNTTAARSDQFHGAVDDVVFEVG